MRNGINLIVKFQDMELTLYNLPPPSSTRVLSSSKGNYLDVYYLFEYSPQSWKEWQRVGSIKIQIKQALSKLKIDVRFKDIYLTQKDNELFQNINVKKLYTVSELGRYYTQFVKYPRPLYPTAKSEFMKCLTLYAKRLHYEDKLYFENLLAMALHFNKGLELNYKARELSKKTKSILGLDKSKWRVKLNDRELKKAHSKGGLIRVEQKREQKEIKREKALKLRESGKTLKEISESLEVSLRTVNSWKLPKVKKSKNPST